MKTKRYHREMEVTRQLALQWLERIPERQRTMNSGVAKRYAKDMRAGKWWPGIAVVAFDRQGKLINGQHVLNGLVLSELPKISVIVSRNHDPGAYAGFDKNRKRSASDDLKQKGIERAGEVGTVAAVIWQYEHGCYTGTSYTGARGGDKIPTTAEICETVDTHDGIGEHLHKNPFRTKGHSIGALRAASYILYQLDPRNSQKFFTSLLEGTGIPTRDHPVCVLRDYFLKNSEHGFGTRHGITLAAIFKAFNAYLRKDTITGTLLKKNEPFPELRVGAPLEVLPKKERSEG